MNEHVTLSIIIAAHNSGGYLQSTLQTLQPSLGANIDRCEFILINDTSTDNTENIFRSFSQHFKQAHYYQVDFRNIGKVRQYAVTMASGKYITMLDSDDMLKEGALSEIINFLEDNQPDILITKLHEFTDISVEDKAWYGLCPIKLSKHKALKKFLIHKDYQAHLIGQFILRDLLIDNPFPEFTCYEDLFIFPKLLMQAKKIVFSHTSPYLYFKHEDSLSGRISREKVSYLICCIKEMDAFLPEKYCHLITCHWLDIYLKKRKYLTEAEKVFIADLLQKRIGFAFFMNHLVRLSFKRKAFCFLIEKIAQEKKKAISF